MELIIFTKFKIKQTTFVTNTAILYLRKTLWISQRIKLTPEILFLRERKAAI